MDTLAGAGDEAADDGGLQIEIDVEQAAAIMAVRDMLQRPSLRPEVDAPALDTLLAQSGAPLRVGMDPAKGRCLVATRRIAAGETLFAEEATAWFLSRSPGSDGVYSIAGPDGALLTTLPPWHVLRLLRDTLSFPAHATAPETGYALLTQLVSGDAVDGNFGPAASSVPAVAPGIPDASDTSGVNAVPPRAQLLAQIAQCNAFSAALPDDDSAWKRALLWPALGRVVDAADRDVLFDDPAPLSAVSAFFVLGGLFNHSCAPSVRCKWGAARLPLNHGLPTPSLRCTDTGCAWVEGAPAPRVAFTAARDIEEGEEATHAYLDPDQPLDERRRALLLTYGFVCRCERCSAELADAAGGAASASGPRDALASAGHFPNGNAARGRAAFFAGGGHYPVSSSQRARDSDADGAGAPEGADGMPPLVPD